MKNIDTTTNSGTPFVLAELKNATKHLHDNLERVSFAKEIMSRHLNEKQYFELLYKNHIIYKQIEPQLNSGLMKVGKLFPQLFTSLRLRDLEKDLAFFPKNKINISFNPSFKLEHQNEAAWLGVLYVLEGSRLGGNVIVKALRNNPNLKSFPEFHFYQQKNIDIRSRWMAFQKAATQNISLKKDVEDAVNAANLTFECFYQVHQKPLMVN